MKVSDRLALDCLSVANEIVARRQDDHFDRDTELFQLRWNWRPSFLDVNEYLHESTIMAPNGAKQISTEPTNSVPKREQLSASRHFSEGEVP
jgi:hypothetical protein